MRLHLGLEIAVDAILQRHRLAVAQLGAAFIGQPAAIGLGVEAEVSQFLDTTTQSRRHRLQFGLGVALDAVDDLFRIVGVPTDRAQDGVLLGRRQLDLARLQHLADVSTEGVVIRRLVAADRLHQLKADPDQLALPQPESGIDQLGALFGIQGGFLLLAPGLDRLGLRLQEAGLVDLVAMLGPQMLHWRAQGLVKTQGFQPFGAELGAATVGAFDGDLVITEIAVVEDPRRDADRVAVSVQVALDRLEGQVGGNDGVDLLGREFAVLVAQVLAQLAIHQVGVDQLHAAPPRRGLGVGQQPDVGGDASVVEQVIRQLDDGVQQVVFDDVAADVGFAAARVAGEQAGAVVDRGDTRADGAVGDGLHLAHHLHQEQQLPVAGAGGGVDGFHLAPKVGQIDPKARVDDVLAILDVPEFAAPAFAVGRVGQHEVEALAREFVGRQRGADLDVLGVVALDHHVGFADGVGLVVDFLAVKIDVAPGGDGALGLLDVVLGLGQHPAAAAGRVVDGHHRGQLAADRVEDEVGHQVDDLPRGEVLPGFLVVLFVELADQLFKDIAHAEVRQAGHQVAIRVLGVVGRQVDVGGDELFEDVEQDLLVRHVPHLLLQLEAGDDLFDVVAESAEVFLDVGQQDLLVVRRGGVKLLQGPLAGVVEDVTRGGSQGGVVQFGGLHLFALEVDLRENVRFRRLQQGVEAAQDDHRQDHIAVFAADIDVAEAVVGNGPNEGDQLIVGGLVHDNFACPWLAPMGCAP